MQANFDVVIIGSGAGGAPIAHELVKLGRSVLVLEKGPLFRPQYQTADGLSDFKRDELYSDAGEKRISASEVANNGSSFFSSHVEPDINDEPHIYRDAQGRDRATIEGYTAQVVGGGTQIYGGVSLRFTPRDLRLATFAHSRKNAIQHDPKGDIISEARDWPISYDELEIYYCKAERLMGINGQRQNQLKPFSAADTYQRPLEPNDISRYAYDGMAFIGRGQGPGGVDVLPYRTPLAVITEDHKPSGRKMIATPNTAKTGYVNRYGCALGLKSSTWVALLAPIEKEANFELRANCVVTRLISEGDKISEVRYLDPSGGERCVRGRVVVVACSAIESVRLLKLSAAVDENLRRRLYANNDLLGRYFLTHAFGGASSTMPTRVDKSRSLDSDWAIDYCATDEFLEARGLWAGAVIYNNTSDAALPISLGRTHRATDLDTLWHGFRDDLGMVGQGIVNFFDANFGRGLSVSFMANQVPQRDNRIELHPTVTDKWNRPVAHILKTWHEHDRYLMDTLAQECAQVLRAGGDPVNHNYPVNGFGGVYTGENGIARIANHILGGARFGTDKTDSVLDANCRVHEVDNLYVTDGAFMPTSGGANPTLTIEANSFRVADVIGKTL